MQESWVLILFQACIGLRLLFYSLLSCDGLIVHKENTVACVEDFGNWGFRGGCDMNKSVMVKEEEEEEREENKNNKRNGEKEVVETNTKEKK
jgi:hypothetical protein